MGIVGGLLLIFTSIILHTHRKRIKNMCCSKCCNKEEKGKVQLQVILAPAITTEEINSQFECSTVNLGSTHNEDAIVQIEDLEIIIENTDDLDKTIYL